MKRHRKTLAEELRDKDRAALNGPKATEIDYTGDHNLGDLPVRAEASGAGCDDWPDPPSRDAYHGIAGELVRVIEPASEADPAALLLSALVGFGNLVGRTAHFVVESTRHYPNEYLVLVGRTSKARKGTSWDRVHGVLVSAEERWADGRTDAAPWAANRVQTGLSSGEGVIWNVRDPIMGRERVKDKGQPGRYEEVETDPGISDKRLMVIEPEFANVLKQVERQGNTLSAVLRQAWESGDLRSMTKNSPGRATGAHLSIVGHVTTEELRRSLGTTEIANGLANRFLWACVRRSKALPEGGYIDPAELENLSDQLAAELEFGRRAGEVRRDAEARELWCSEYAVLSEGKPGLTGALLGRAEAHVMRLAMLYALLDMSDVIAAVHLRAALATWDYCERSVRHIFGDHLGDPVADEIVRALRSKKEGLTRAEVSDLFGRHRSAAEIGRALGLLVEFRLAESRPEKTAGRPAERWFATVRSARKAMKVG